MNIIVHYPKSEEGKRELAKRVAEAHAEAVNSYILSLNCPTEQKLALFDAIIKTVKDNMNSQEE
jgi:hypothetical protein